MTSTAERPLRILHLNEHLAPKGGVETYLLSLLPRLEAEGHTAGFVYAQGDASLVENAFALPELARAGRRVERSARAATNEILDRFDPDVVHVHGVHNIGAVDACLLRVPVVLTSHDYRFACPASTFYYRRTGEICRRTCSTACFAVTVRKRCLSLRPSYGWNYYRRVRWAIRNASRFAHLIAPSRGAASRMSDAGFEGSRTTVLPYFCRMEPRLEPRRLPAEPQLLYLGRLSPNKGWRVFLEALGRLPSGVQGTVVGNMTAEGEASVRGAAREFGCDDRLECRSWAGPAEIHTLFESTTALVFPSLWDETLGIVGLESLAHGVPVVASDVGGVREWLLDGETGYLAEPGNAASFVTGLERILADDALAIQLGRAGLDLIRERFGPERHVRELLNVYYAAAVSASARRQDTVRGR